MTIRRDAISHRSGEDKFHGADVGLDDDNDNNDNDDWGKEGGEKSSLFYSSGMCTRI